MKRQELEKLINPTEYNKSYYTKDGWEYLFDIATALELVVDVCYENGLQNELNSIINIEEEDYAYQVLKIYRHIKEKKNGENILETID